MFLESRLFLFLSNWSEVVQEENAYQRTGFNTTQKICLWVFCETRHRAPGHTDGLFLLIINLILSFKYLFINSIKFSWEFSAPRGLASLTSAENSNSQQIIKFYFPRKGTKREVKQGKEVKNCSFELRSQHPTLSPSFIFYSNVRVPQGIPR